MKPRGSSEEPTRPSSLAGGYPNGSPKGTPRASNKVSPLTLGDNTTSTGGSGQPPIKTKVEEEPLHPFFTN